MTKVKMSRDMKYITLWAQLFRAYFNNVFQIQINQMWVVINI